MITKQAIALWAALVWIILAANVYAVQLEPAKWSVTELETGKNFTREVTDGDLNTMVTLQDPAGLVIDLGQSCVLQRVFLCGGRHKMMLWPNAYDHRDNPPLGLIVAFVGDSADTTRQVAEFTVPYDAGDPIDTQVDMRFQPASGRYVRLELKTKVHWGKEYWPGYTISNAPKPIHADWNVSEVELYGFSGVKAQLKDDAVVLDKGAAAPLALAAEDLSYYLGELTGKPHPVITPDEVALYPGTLYRIMDLKPLAPTYEVMLVNQQAGNLPDGVNVEREGREVLFRAWPYRCVLWSVWEFLERQGVRWLYPDAHGDFVPVGQGVSLKMLPLKVTPSARSIYANWDTSALEPWPPWMKQATLQGYLYPWRNHWNCSWGNGPLGGAEIPVLKAPAAALNDDYKEGFDGYPHNFNAVLPDRILQAHPDWYGYSTRAGKRGPGTAFCMSDPQLIAWVADKMVAVNQAAPLAVKHPLNLRHFDRAYNLLPTDASSYCQCDRCTAVNEKEQDNTVPWVRLYKRSMSSYYSLVCGVANAVKTRAPDITVGALAYADVFLPPSQIGRFPDNVQVEVCMYGAPNLPMSSPRNAGMKKVLEAWHAKCRRLTTYDYALLHIDYWQKDPRLPVPMVTATVERANYLYRLGALDGGCQATPESFPYNPWNFYAYSRIRWNVSQPAPQLLREFFTGYFQEASAPMLAYYQALEDHLLAHDVSLHFQGYCYGITPGSFPISVLAVMKKDLEAAEQRAKSWVVKERVARMREGFDWVIAESGLKGVELTDLSGYPKIGAGTNNIELKKMGKPGGNVSGNFTGLNKNGEWCFWSQGHIAQQLNFTQGGNYTVTVAARSVPYENISPIMNVFIGANGSQLTVDATEWHEYSFTTTVPAGVWNMVISYSNAATGGRRNMFIKEIRVVRQD